MIIDAALTTIGVLLGIIAIAIPLAVAALLIKDLVLWTLRPRWRTWRSRRRLYTR